MNTSEFVPGHGSTEDGIVIVGRDPGRTEIAQGKPFVGRSGELLNEELESNNIDRSSIYVTNALLCHFGGKGKPPRAAVNACQDRLISEIKRAQPKKVLVLRETAAEAVCDESRTIANWRGNRALRSRFLGDDIAVDVTYHPGAVLRNPNLRPLIASDIKAFVDS